MVSFIVSVYPTQLALTQPKNIKVVKSTPLFVPHHVPKHQTNKPFCCNSRLPWCRRYSITQARNQSKTTTTNGHFGKFI